MILADTSVVIAQQRKPTVKWYQLIQAHGGAVCGVTVAEVYSGARTPAEFANCSALLGLFGRVTFPESLWETVGRYQAGLQGAGQTVPLSDTMIAAAAVHHGVELWTYDVHFSRMLPLVPGLRLFQEPP
jgi:predicted nucleic acid-binding protein